MRNGLLESFRNIFLAEEFVTLSWIPAQPETHSLEAPILYAILLRCDSARRFSDVGI